MSRIFEQGSRGLQDRECDEPKTKYEQKTATTPKHGVETRRQKPKPLLSKNIMHEPKVQGVCK